MFLKNKSRIISIVSISCVFGLSGYLAAILHYVSQLVPNFICLELGRCREGSAGLAETSH